MPRTRRKPSGTDVYHVVSRGNNQQDIFLLEKDKNRLYGIIKEQAEKFGVKIYAYCIMSNHVHILLKAEFKALSSFMRETNSMYAAYYNYKYKQSGHVFQGRFFSSCVETEGYLLSCVRYIHNNPVKAGIVHDIIAYPYSSAGDYFSLKGQKYQASYQKKLQTSSKTDSKISMNFSNFTTFLTVRNFWI